MAGVKMGCARHSVAVAVLVMMMMMMIGTSHCMVVNQSTTTAASDTASSDWCNGHMVDGQCMLLAQHYYGGEHLEYDMVAEYPYDSGESSRRVLGRPTPISLGAVYNPNAACNGPPNKKYPKNCHGKPNPPGKSNCPNNASPYRRDC